MPDASGQDRAGAFAALVARRRDQLVRSAQRILRRTDEAEDVVQDTLARVWPRLDRIEPQALTAYVFRAVRCNTLKRLARRRPQASLDGVAEPAAAAEPDADDPAQIDPLTLERALAQLPPAQRTAIRLRYYMGLTFQEIGTTLSISTNTAASRCRYALAALRKTILSRRKDLDHDGRNTDR